MISLTTRDQDIDIRHKTCISLKRMYTTFTIKVHKILFTTYDKNVEKMENREDKNTFNEPRLVQSVKLFEVPLLSILK